MVEHNLSVEKIDYTISKYTNAENNYEISTPFTATVSPEIIFGVEEVQQSSLTINVQGGLAQAGSSGSGRWSITIISIYLKSSDNTTTYASADIQKKIYGDYSSGAMVGTQLVISNPTAFLKALSTQSVSIAMYFEAGGSTTYVPRIYVADQSLSITTTGQLIITANTPQQLCGEVSPTFKLSGTTNDTTDPLTYRWEYSEQGLNSWTAINTPATSLDYTWVVSDPSISRGKTYDISILCNVYNIRSNVVSVTIYHPPEIIGPSVSPANGFVSNQLTLQCDSIHYPPKDGLAVRAPEQCPNYLQWQYNNGSPDEWIALDGATSRTYSWQFTATAPETQFRLQVISEGGAGYSDPVTYTAYTPMFPLNVEIGSPQYTTVSQINYSAGEVTSVQVTPTTSGTTPVSNSYYTFQSQDGLYWITGYVVNWTDNDGAWTADIVWSSSNTDSLPAQSICWCIWTKEYYQSIVDRMSSKDVALTVITPFGDTWYTLDTTYLRNRGTTGAFIVSFVAPQYIDKIAVKCITQGTYNTNFSLSAKCVSPNGTSITVDLSVAHNAAIGSVKEQSISSPITYIQFNYTANLNYSPDISLNIPLSWFKINGISNAVYWPVPIDNISGDTEVALMYCPNLSQ